MNIAHGHIIISVTKDTTNDEIGVGETLSWPLDIERGTGIVKR